MNTEKPYSLKHLPNHGFHKKLWEYYNGKTAWVIGGSEGIGAGLAQYLTFFGASVLIVSRHPSKLDITINQMKGLKQSPEQKLQSLALDITNYSKVKETLSHHIEKETHLDIIINCAGYSHPGFFTETPIQAFHDMMNLNYFGTVNVLKIIVPHMIRNKKGQILNVSSMAGYLGLFGYSGYCGSKFAVIGLSEALKRELKPYNIYVSVLCPPATRTPGFKMENKTKPTEVLNIEKKAKILSPDQVALSTLEQLRGRTFLINPSFESKAAHLLNRLAPSILELFVKR